MTSTLRASSSSGRLGACKLAARIEQRARHLGRLELLRVQTGLLERHRGMRGERGEQPLAILVELHDADHDPAVRAVTARERRGGPGEIGSPTEATQVSPSHSDACSVSNSAAAVSTVSA